MLHNALLGLLFSGMIVVTLMTGRNGREWEEEGAKKRPIGSFGKEKAEYTRFLVVALKAKFKDNIINHTRTIPYATKTIHTDQLLLSTQKGQCVSAE